MTALVGPVPHQSAEGHRTAASNLAGDRRSRPAAIARMRDDTG
jgi:hypothetical protein